MINEALAHNTHKLVTDLRGKKGLSLPAEVDDADARLQRIIARKPAVVEPESLADAYVDEVDDDTLHALAAQHLASQPLLAARSTAIVKAGRALRAAITSNGDAITKQLQKLAAKPISELQAAAALDTLDTAALIRNGRPEDAATAASVDLHFAELANLYALRHKVTQGASYGDANWGADCSRWRDPRKIGPALNLPTGAEGYLVGIRAGAGLWFPLPAEAEAQALPLIREAQEQAKAERATEWGRGSLVR